MIYPYFIYKFVQNVFGVLLADEKEYCSIGELGSPTPQAICGPGLMCKRLKNQEHPKCYPSIEKITSRYIFFSICTLLNVIYSAVDNTKCMQDRNAFDKRMREQNVGHLMERPSCNADGLYNPIKCIPGQL